VSKKKIRVSCRSLTTILNNENDNFRAEIAELWEKLKQTTDGTNAHSVASLEQQLQKEKGEEVRQDY